MKNTKTGILCNGTVILLLLAAISTSSCGKEGQTGNTTTNSGSEEETAAVTEVIQKETKPIDSIGTLSELDFNGYNLLINCSTNEAEWPTGSIYLMNQEEETGDLVQDLVLRRNKDIEEALNLTVSWSTKDLIYYDVEKTIIKEINSGDHLADLYINDQFGLSKIMIEGGFRNIYDLAEEDSYFDFTADGWYTDYMDELSILKGARYLLAGDYFIDVLRASHVMYFNKNLMVELSEGYDELYQHVFNGTWTYDVFLDYFKDIYKDLNNNGKRDPEDVYGFTSMPSWGALYFCTTDCATVSYDENGIPYVDPTTERTSQLVDKLLSFWPMIGFREAAANTEFYSGNIMFSSWLKISDMERAEARNMDGIGIIPYPKLDDKQKDYRTLVHNTAEVGAVPVTAPDEAMAPLSAYLQAVTQYSSKYIMPAYYETALKVKYVQDNESAKVLDIIKAGITAPFEYTYSSYLASLGYYAVNDSLAKQTNTIASYIESNLAKVQNDFDKMLSQLSDTLNN